MDQAEGNVELSHLKEVEQEKGTLDQHHKFFGKRVLVELHYMATKNLYKTTTRLQMSTVASLRFEKLYHLIKRSC